MNKPIGIVGLGSLGSRLAIQIASAGFDVIAFDRGKKAFENPKIHIAQSESEVLENCSIVHWAIPSKSLNNLSDSLGEAVIILHDSVMNNSRSALDERTDSGNFAIAHCLMNKVRRVFVASDGSHSEAVMRHFESIGLSPKLTTVKEHDILMAHSQGILATLINSGLRNELDRASLEGDLTPSGEELHRLLTNPELDWTPNTLKSILANPEREQSTLVIISKTEDNGR